MRASNVVYDRAHSSISTAEAADFDFDRFLTALIGSTLQESLLLFQTLLQN